MSANDPKTKSATGEYHGKFWFLTGGGINPGESFQEAALRELFEETGISKEEVELGPIVWFGEFDLIIADTLTHLKQTFIVMRTKKKKVSFAKLDEREKKVLDKLSWFSLDKIENSNEIIYPVVLAKYLPDIIAKKYPKKPMMIDLAKQPKKKPK